MGGSSIASPSCVEGQASCFLVSLVQRMVALLEKGELGGMGNRDLSSREQVIAGVHPGSGSGSEVQTWP